MKAKNISENSLLEIGFEKQYAHRKDGFYTLDVNDKFYFTVDFKTMTLSIQLKGYGHIQKLGHIKTIEQVADLFFALTGKSLLEVVRNGNIKSQQEKIVVDWTDNDVKIFFDKLFDVANKATSGHMVEPKNIDKEKEKSFARWVKNLIKRTNINLK